MTELRIYLLGAPRVEVDGVAVSFDTRKAIALLAYLAVTRQQHTRDTLAALLWPDADQTHARGALRRTLSTLAAALGPAAALGIEREAVELRSEARGPAGMEVDDQLANPATVAVWSDAWEFQQIIDQCRRRGRTPEMLCAACRALLTRAVDLYRDDFLAGFSLRDSSTFDDWQFFQAEHLRRELAGALESLVACATNVHDWDAAISAARRWLALDSLHEPVHRRLMELYAWSGQRSAALRQFQECRRILDDELGVPPLAETTALHQAILDNRLSPPPAVTDVAPGAQEVARLAALRPPPTGSVPATPTRFVSREAEWRTLTAGYDRSAGAGYLLALEGEAGIGKTTLARALADHAAARGATVLTATCYEGEETLAYAPITQLLRAARQMPDCAQRLRQVDRTWLAETRRLLPEIDAQIVGLPRTSVEDPAAAQGRFFEGLAQTLRALLAGEVPGLLWIDDVHWADAATVEWLGYLLRRLHGFPVCVVLTWRDVDLGPDHRLRRLLADAVRRGQATLVSLTPLDRAAIQRLVAQAKLPAGVDRNLLAERLQQEADGVPFVMVEYLRLVAAGDLALHEPGWPTPGRVRELLLARVVPAGEVARQVLTTAAVIGRSFDLETLIAASGRTEDEAIDALDELVARRLVVETGAATLDFAHARLRSLMLEESSQVRRRLLHRRVAEALLAGARRRGQPLETLAGALAGHYHLAGDDAQAAGYALLAGEYAYTLYANQEAANYLESALKWGCQERCRALSALGDVRTLLGSYRAALQAYQAALIECADTAGLHQRIGRVWRRLGDTAEAVRSFSAALAALPAESMSSRAEILADWSLALFAAETAPEAYRLAQEALTAAEAATEPAALAHVHNLLAIQARRRGEVVAAIAHGLQSLAAAEQLAEPLPTLDALNSLALARTASGEPRQAVALLQRALEHCTRLGDRHREATVHNNLADAYQLAGQTEQAMRHLKQAVAILADIGADAGRTNAEIWKISDW